MNVTLRSSPYRKRPLGEVADVISGFAFKSTDFGDKGIPVIKIKNIRLGYVDLNEASYVDEKHLSIPDRFHVKSGDVLISLTGSHITQPNSVVGRIARHSESQPRCLLNQRAGKIIAKDMRLCDPRFLFYALSERETMLAIAVKAHGAASQANVSPSQVESIEIPFPTLPVQQRIVAILSAYDELIENSQRRIEILESMARALYGEALSTCTDASKPHPIVDSPYWRFISENVSPYSGSKRYYATADIDGLATTGPGIDYEFSDKPSRAQKQPIANSVWFARMKDTYKIPWYGPVSDERATGTVLSSGFAGFEAAEAELWPLLFLTISSKNFHVQKDLFCTGATQMSLTNEGLTRIAMPLPDEPTARRLGQTAAPMLKAMAALQKRNENLRRTRDLLLPRLLSGQINVEAP